MKKAFLLLPFLLLCFVSSAFAETIIYKWEGSALYTKPTYYPEYDKYIGTFNKNVVKHIIHRGYTDSSFTNMRNQWDFYSPNDTGAVFDGFMYWNCSHTYIEDIFLDANEQQVGISRFYSGDIQVAKCTSKPNYPPNSDAQDQADLDDYFSKHGDGSGSGGNQNCTVCCPELNNAVNDIKDSINSNGDKLGEVLGQIKTDKTVDSGDSITQPNIQNKDVNDYKPSEQPAFKDNTNYFSDKGDSSDVAGDLPGVPDVAPCWGATCRQGEKGIDSELDKTGELDKDGELTSQPMDKDGQLNKDKELTSDSMDKDAQMSKDGELTSQPMDKDGQMSKDGEMDKDSQFNKDTEMGADLPMKKDEQMPVIPYAPSENYDSTNSMSRDNFYSQKDFYNVSE